MRLQRQAASVGHDDSLLTARRLLSVAFPIHHPLRVSQRQVRPTNIQRVAEKPRTHRRSVPDTARRSAPAIDRSRRAQDRRRHTPRDASRHSAVANRAPASRRNLRKPGSRLGRRGRESDPTRTSLLVDQEQLYALPAQGAVIVRLAFERVAELCALRRRQRENLRRRRAPALCAADHGDLRVVVDQTGRIGSGVSGDKIG